MHKTLPSIFSLFRFALQALRVRQYAVWFIVSGLVFTVISRLLVVLPPLSYIAMQATGQTVLYGILLACSMVFIWYVIVVSFALFLLVSRRIALGQPLGIKVSFLEAHRAVGRTTGTIFLLGLFVLAGCIALIIPGFIVGILCFFAPTIAVLGNNKKKLFLQSRMLYKGRFWAVFLRLAIVYALTLIPTYALSRIHPVAGQVWGITTSFFSFLFTKIYLDLEQTKA